MNIDDCKCDGLGHQLEISPSQGSRERSSPGEASWCAQGQRVLLGPVTLSSIQMSHSCVDVKARPP